MLLEMQQAEKAMLITVTHSVELANRFARKLHFVDGLVTESDLDGVDQQERIES
jgi:ABC-type lipoprotein export system ATPase subunit